MKRYRIIICNDGTDIETHTHIWASTPRSAVSMAATKRYGPHGFSLAPDDTVMEVHANNADNTESLMVF